jgi:rhodanese-related sulfurtransferase
MKCVSISSRSRTQHYWCVFFLFFFYYHIHHHPYHCQRQAAQNIVEGLVSQVEWKDLERLAQEEDQQGNTTTLIVDVRNPGEIQSTGVIAENAINIPLHDLRRRLEELPRDKHLVISCASGQRAYYACRILKQHGFDNVDSLGGAYATFHAIHPTSV